MPKLDYLNKRIIWDQDDFSGTLHPQYGGALVTRQSNYFSNVRSFDPYRFVANVSPSYFATDVTNVSVVDHAILNATVNTTFAYGVSQGTKIFQWDLISDTLTNDSTYPHAISGAVGSDCITATLNGTTYILVSYNTGSTGDVCRITPGTPDTFTDSYYVGTLSGSLSKSNPHPFGKSDIYKNRYYVADGNAVHIIDGASSVTLDATQTLTIDTGFTITGFANLPEYVVVFAYQNSATSGQSDPFYRGQAKAYLWDETSPLPTRVIDLNDNYVSAPFKYQGTVGCFTYGRMTDPTGNRIGKLQLFSAGTAEDVSHFATSTAVFQPVAYYVGNAPVVGGVDVRGNQIVWNSSGKVFTYNHPFITVPGQPPYAVGLNQTTEGGGSTSGLLKALTGSAQFISSGTTTSGGLQTLDSSNYTGVTIYKSSLAEPLFPIREQGQIKSVKITFAKTASSAAPCDLIFTDSAGGTINQVLSAITSVASGQLIQKFDADYQGNSFNYFASLGLSISYGGVNTSYADAVIISKVEVFYDNVNINQ